jgi:N-formylglutamate amidohydrolase
MPRFPVLILIPHGGSRIPEEFSEISHPDDIDIVFSSDAGANEIFSVSDCPIMTTNILPLYTDLDRPSIDLPPGSSDGVIKTRTALGENLFDDNALPDYVAITGILKRYYFPYYQTVKKILATGEIRLVIECHTVAAAGSPSDDDADVPRPLFSIQTKRDDGSSLTDVCDSRTAESLLSHVRKALSGEKHALREPFTVSGRGISGNLCREFSGKIPYMRVNLSRALFLNDEYFNQDFAKVDGLRLSQLKKCIDEGFSRFFTKEYNG